MTLHFDCTALRWQARYKIVYEYMPLLWGHICRPPSKVGSSQRRGRSNFSSELFLVRLFKSTGFFVHSKSFWLAANHRHRLWRASCLSMHLSHVSTCKGFAWPQTNIRQVRKQHTVNKETRVRLTRREGLIGNFFSTYQANHAAHRSALYQEY